MGVIPRVAMGHAAALAGLAACLLATAAFAAARPLVRTVGDAQVDWTAGTVTCQGGAAANLDLPGPDHARTAAERLARQRATVKLAEALQMLPLGADRRPSSAAIEAAVARARVKEIEYQSNGGVRLSIELTFADLTREGAKELVQADPAGGSNKSNKADPSEKSGKDGTRAPSKTTTPVSEPDLPANGDGNGEGGSATRDAGPVKARHVTTARPGGDPVPEVILSVASTPLEMAPTVLVRGVEHRLGSAVYRMGEAPRAAKAISVKRDRRGRLSVGAAAKAIDWSGAHAVIYTRTVSPASSVRRAR